MKSFFAAAVLGSLLGFTALTVPSKIDQPAPPTKTVVVTVPVLDLAVCERLQNASVTVRTDEGTGSGVVFRHKDGTVVVWTAAHVIGEAKKVFVVTDLVYGGNKVGEISVAAKVLITSEELDVAILEPEYRDQLTQAVTFLLSGELPKVGQTIIHVGSWYGELGSQSLSVGVVSKVGRTIKSALYDQFTAAATPGSSGGGVFLPDGRCLGLVLRQANVNFNLMVPIRSLQQWADAAGYGWALDPEKAKP